MLRIVARDSAMAVTRPRRSPDIRVTPADSMATSVPVPIAMPTSADASAGASLTPSPTIATACPRAWRSATAAALPSGRTSAMTRSMPAAPRDRLGGPSVVAGEHRDLETEPMELGDRLDRARLERVGDGDDGDQRGRRWPRRRASCRRRPVPPRLRRVGRGSISAASRGSPGRPTTTATPSTVARMPPPAIASNAVASGTTQAARLDRVANDRVRQWMLGATLGGRDEARGPRSSGGRARQRATTSVTRGLPSVSVPVLSSTIARTEPSRSRASALRNRTPASAPLPVPTMIDVGVASPRAQGQAMIRTATVLSRARLNAGAGPSDEPDDERQRRRGRARPARSSRSRRRRGAGSAPASPAPRRPAGRSGPGRCRRRPAWPGR